ncbi:hypothetical protein [Planctomycetes bacterium SV_7m_r]|uniref:hypothetical protein n=1 Tax=Stieleria bergensis TaxID=2528025 RepID=UPI0011A1E709
MIGTACCAKRKNAAKEVLTPSIGKSFGAAKNRMVLRPDLAVPLPMSKKFATERLVVYLIRRTGVKIG